jgi:hypothetical protein
VLQRGRPLRPSRGRAARCGARRHAAPQHRRTQSRRADRDRASPSRDTFWHRLPDSARAFNPARACLRVPGLDQAEDREAGETCTPDEPLHSVTHIDARGHHEVRSGSASCGEPRSVWKNARRFAENALGQLGPYAGTNLDLRLSVYGAVYRGDDILCPGARDITCDSSPVCPP